MKNGTLILKKNFMISSIKIKWVFVFTKQKARIFISRQNEPTLISSGPNARYRVWEAFTFTILILWS